MQCTFAGRAEGCAPCSCLGSADVHIDSNSGKHVFSFYAFFNNKICTVFESQPLNCGRTWDWCSLTVWGHNQPQLKVLSSFTKHDWAASWGQRTCLACPGDSYSALLHPWNGEGPNLMGRGWWFHKERLCGHLLALGASYPGMRDLCVSSSLKIVACAHPTTGNALSGKEGWRRWVKFSSWLKCSKHNIKEPLDFQLAEKKRRTSDFYSSQANSTLHALCLQLTQRGRVMGNGTSAHPPICNAGKMTSKAWSSWFS